MTAGCPRLSVVITAYNAAHTIGACLLSLKDQQGVMPGEMEVVVVNDRSTDDLEQAVAAVGLEVVLLRIDRYLPGGVSARQQALDLGIRTAKGEVIAVIDADGIVPPHWARAGMDRLRIGRVDVLAGYVAFGPPWGWLGALQNGDTAFYLTVCRALNRMGLPAGVLFGNCFFSRRAYLALGGFDALGFALTEDLQFARALHRHGYRIAYQSEQVVRVKACHNLLALVTRAERVSAGKVSVLSLTIAFWMAILALLFGLALLGGGWIWAVLGLRYAAGVGLIAAATPVAYRRRYLPAAVCLIYEPLALAIGIWVALRVVRHRSVQWAGVVYDR